ncbi:MAG: hypothetical protein ACOYLP_11080 [Flavobacterium sp.]|uniref:hypothetical protein n=1 Tax=Flavobacterium sp. TaxID=239 RepID=UPI003BCF8111
MLKYIILFSAFLISIGADGQSQAKTKRMLTDAKKAKSMFIKTDAQMENLFNSSYAYVISPNVGKGGFGIGELLEMVLFTKTKLRLEVQNYLN